MRDVKEPEVRQAEIIQAALSLFAEKGYEKTTTQDIIDKAHISRGLLYYHFKNKEDILLRMIECRLKERLTKIETLAHDSSKTALQKLNLFIEYTLIPSEDITSETTMLQDTVNSEKNRYLLDRFSHSFIHKMTPLFARIIKQGNAENVFRVTHPDQTASFLLTGYVFVGDEMKLFYTDKKLLTRYMKAFKELLTRALGVSVNCLSDKRKTNKTP